MTSQLLGSKVFIQHVNWRVRERQTDRKTEENVATKIERKRLTSVLANSKISFKKR